MMRTIELPGRASQEESLRTNCEWLFQLRLILIVGKVALIGLIHGWFHLQLPLVSLGLLVGVEAVSNVALRLLLRRATPLFSWLLGVVMTLDLVLLTGIFILTGGPANPFSFLYLVYIAMGILVLESRWMWFLCVFTLVCYGSLFLVPLAPHHSMHSHHSMKLHMEGMWLAYAITTVLIVYFVTRMKFALQKRERELALLYDLQVRSEKLASLAALAGGAMHEIATPLSTIALVAKELERGLNKSNQQPEMVEDARLIREQVENCRDILQTLVSQAGENLGEASQSIELRDFVKHTLDVFQERERVQTDVPEELLSMPLWIPIESMGRVIRNLLHNGLEASTPGQSVQLSMRQEEAHLLIQIIDNGTGIPQHVMEQVGEPFFTTKPAGRGHGLGVFLATNLAERLGGQLVLESELEVGTTVKLLLPLEILEKENLSTLPSNVIETANYE